MKKGINFVIFMFVISYNLFLKSASVNGGITGKIVGTVIDAETGDGLIGANVIIEGTTKGAATNLDGYYMILNVTPGTYTIRAAMMGYQNMSVENVRVSIDLTSTVDFKLTSTVLIGEEVIVVAERPLVRADITSSQASVGREEIAALPVEEIAEILELQAGMMDGHMRGGRASEIAYQIDGVSVTDPFSGEKAVDIENMAIQELQVISGTFNAEYGQAMSGIVNIVTKDGGEKISGNLSIYSGDYISKHKDTFYNIDNINLKDIIDIQASFDGSMPGLNKKLSFFSSARFLRNNGYLYGQRLFNPGDNPLDPSYTGYTGDGVPVSMNRNKSTSFQGKLTYNISPNLKLSYGMLWDRNNFRSPSHDFLYNPDGDYQRHEKSYSHSLNWNHLISSKTFYTVSFSHFFYDYRYYVFQDPEEILSGEKIDPRYVDPDLLNINVANFRSGGTEMEHFQRNTATTIGKFDITSQITQTHQVKTGIEIRRHRLYLHEFELISKIEQGIKIEPFEPDIPTINSPLHNKYTHYPIEASAYIQDKMEFSDIIVNIGLRYDVFEPDGKVPTDLRDPHNDVTEVWDYNLDTLITGLDPVEPINEDGSYSYWRYKYRKAKLKHQISPRIGISYPITDRGVIHFSYGHFFQIPTFEHLYIDPEFEVEKGLNTRMGNANLNPQKTVIYEIGLQQQLSENIGMHVTGFYKDIRDLLGTEIHETYIIGNRYALYVNRDYGNVRGITIAFDRRRSDYLSASIDYTYQVAEGNASDPNASFWDNQSIPPIESEKQVVPLNWDQTHTLNLSVTLGQPDNWGVSVVGRYGSGFPYTPAFQYQRTGIENSERKPHQYNVDLKIYKTFQLGPINYSLYFKIFNLFDRMNEDEVYSDTGRAGYTLTRSTGLVSGPLTYDDYYKRAEFYSAPRQIRVGLSIGF